MRSDHLIEPHPLLWRKRIENSSFPVLGHVLALVLDVLVKLPIIVKDFSDFLLLGRREVQLGFQVT